MRHKNKRHTFVIGTLKIILTVTIMGAIGVGLGQVALAESKTVNVPGAGYVGTANTVGGKSGSTNHATGISSSTTTLFYLEAYAKMWHWRSAHMGGPSLEDSSSKSLNWTTGVSTNTLYSGVNVTTATRSRFRYLSPTALATEYTSYPNGAGSCHTWWNSGQFC